MWLAILDRFIGLTNSYVSALSTTISQKYLQNGSSPASIFAFSSCREYRQNRYEKVMLEKSRRVRPIKSCVDCRRRKQDTDYRQCILTKEGPCVNCLRRFPPVECVPMPKVKDDGNLPARQEQSGQQKNRNSAPGGTFLQLSKDPSESESYNLILNRRKSRPNSPQMLGGVLTAINSLNSLPIPNTPRNTELFHFCK